MKFFEGARGEWIRALGLTYAEIEERGIYLPVLEVGVRYLKPARYDDVLEIHLRVSHTRVKVRFDYKVVRNDVRARHVREDFRLVRSGTAPSRDCPFPHFTSGRLSGTKFLRFGISTLGNVFASRTASLAMMPLSESRYAVSA